MNSICVPGKNLANTTKYKVVQVKNPYTWILGDPTPNDYS